MSKHTAICGTPWGDWRNPKELKFETKVLVPSTCFLPLVDLDHHSTSCLKTKRQVSYIKKQKILHFFISFTTANGSFYCSPVSNSFIRIDAFAKYPSHWKNPEVAAALRESM
jgi:hypothetical protein